MDKSVTKAERRLARLERVLDGRQARLAASVERRRRPAAAEPLVSLQRYGYPIAFLLGLTAVLPTVISFAWARRELLFHLASNALGMRKVRALLDSARQAEGDR